MGRVVSVVLQFFLFLVVFAAGSFLPGAHLLLPLLSVAAGPGRIFVYDGVLLMLAVYLIILVIGAVRRHLVATALTSTLALMLALALGLAMKFGFKEPERTTLFRNSFALPSAHFQAFIIKSKEASRNVDKL